MALDGRRDSASLDDLLLGFRKEDAPALSWRTARLSDWRLRLGDKIYNVHTAILGDSAHCSELLHAQFTHWAKPTKETNLTDLLPKICWPAFELCLDFSYTGKIELSPENSVLVFKIAHILQMRLLAKEAIASLKLSLRSAAAARVILAHALQLQPGLDLLVSTAKATMAQNLDSFKVDELTPFPFETVAELLSSDGLVARAGQISNIVTAHVRASGSAASFAALSAFVDEPEPEDALYLLNWAISTPGMDARGGISSKCLTAIARDFRRINVSDLTSLPFDMVLDFFESDEITATEDEVFDAICEYITALCDQLPPASQEKLWATCRFAQLTAPKVAAAVDFDHVPAFWFKLGLASSFCNATQGTSAVQAFIRSRFAIDEPPGELQVRRLRPRHGASSFSKMVYDLMREESSGMVVSYRGVDAVDAPSREYNGTGSHKILWIDEGTLALTIEMGSSGDNDQYVGLLADPDESCSTAYLRLKQSTTGFCVAHNDTPFFRGVQIPSAAEEQPWALKGKRVTMVVSVSECRARIWTDTQMVEQNNLPIGRKGITAAIGLYNNSARIIGWRLERSI